MITVPSGCLAAMELAAATPGATPGAEEEVVVIGVWDTWWCVVRHDVVVCGGVVVCLQEGG
jgi:uncharacterized protein YceK